MGFWRLGQENLGILGILVILRTWPGKSWNSGEGLILGS